MTFKVEDKEVMISSIPLFYLILFYLMLHYDGR